MKDRKKDNCFQELRFVFAASPIVKGFGGLLFDKVKPEPQKYETL